MGTVRYRQTTWINGIYIVCLLGCISLAVEEFQHEFDIQLYEKNISWIHCPEGWTKIGIECIKVETEATSYDEAETVCKSYGGHLVKIKGFNLNKVIGETAKEVLSAKAVGSTRAWIGFYRNIDGNYMWSDGHVGEEMEGFWAEGQIIQFVSGIRRCGAIETNGSLYGPNRWHLDKCEHKLPFVCQTIPCVDGQFRCADGQKCITQTSKCDGHSDCQDGSDEMNCTKAQCMGVLDTPKSTFQSPNFPEKYPSYADCKWKVIAPIGSKVQLNFTFFQTEERYDVVKFYDGLSTSDDLIGSFSGSVRPDIVVSSTNFLLITFSSDQDVEMSGFSAKWTSVTSGTCGGNLTAARKLQWFTSPNYPRNYPNNILCDWIITAPEQDRVVTIQIEDFLVDEPLDWLEVHDRGFEEDDLILLLSGNQTVYRNIVSSGRQIFIRFRTSLKHSSQGFNITYQSGCGSLIVKGYGELYSPGYRASSYPNDINCTWTIEDPEGRALTLVFHNFSTEVNFDNVMVFNDSSYSHLAASGPFSGVKNEIIIHSSTGHFLISFVSDGQVSRSGWSASFSNDCTSVFPIPENAQVSQNSSWYGAKINYSCDIGFVINGPIPRVCDIGGVWRTPPPSCSAVVCGSPGTVKNGALVRVNNNSYGGIAEYECDQGFQIDGNYSIVCGTEGWTPLPQCIAVRCPKLKVPSKGRLISPNMYIFGARAEFRCIEGYRLIGASYLHCLTNGQWSDNETSCEPNVTCQELIILHGMLNTSGPVMYRTVIQVTCLPGYKIKGDSNILTCNEAGDYDQTVPTCQDIDECSQNNRTCGYGNHCINTIGSYWCLCANGYQLVPGTTSHCADVNECLINNGGCEHICENNNGSYSCNCQNGYHLYEAENITIFDGRILIPGKSCLVSCPAVKIKNGSIFANSSQTADHSFYYPTVVRILCDPGWESDGEHTIQCQANGTWSANVTQCRVGMCEQLPNISYGTISYNDSLNFGSLATYDCDPDYRLEGSRWRLCHSGFDSEGMPMYQWTGSEPMCASVKWYPPPALNNGRVVYSTTEYGSVANYSCQCGYQLRGSTTRTYLKYGLWSNEEIVCIAKTCPRVGAPLNGNIMNWQNIYPVGSLVQYQCNAGFELQDNRPLLCNFDPGSEEGDLPYLHMLISLRLKPSPSIVIKNCTAPYAEKIIANLKPNISQLSVHCDAIVKVLVDLQENYTVEEDNVNKIIVVLRLQLTLLERVTQASKGCECVESILIWINRNIDIYIPYLSITGFDNCPTVELNPKNLEVVRKEWKCPDNQTMDLPEDVQCEGQVPVCQHNAQDCKPSLPPLTNIYTSTSKSVATRVTTSALTLPTTTDAGTIDGSSSTSTSEFISTATTSDNKRGSTSDTTTSHTSKGTVSTTVSLTGTSSSSTSSMTSSSPMSTIKEITNTTVGMTTTVTTFLGTETTETKSSTGATATSLSSKSTMMTTTTDDDNETPMENITSSTTSSTTSLRVSSAITVSSTLAPTILTTAGVSTTTFMVTQGSSTIKRTTTPLTSTVDITYTPTLSSTTAKTSICPTLESFQSSTTYSNSALTSTMVPGLGQTLLSQSATSPGQNGDGGSETAVFVLQTDTFMSITPNHSADCEKQLNDLISGIVQSIMNCLIENQNQSCKYGYNLHYMDTHGNITIKNDQMNISVPFKVLDKEPSIHSVENCKEDIQVILNHTAVTLLATIPAMMNANCSIRIIFNPNHFQVTYAKWTCRAGYQYDNKTRLCQTCTDCPTETSPTTMSSLPITSSSSFSLPRSTDIHSTNSTSLVSSVELTSFSTSRTVTIQPGFTVTSTAMKSTTSVLTTKTDQLPSTVSATTQHSSSVTTTITTQPALSTTRETSKLSSMATSTQLPSPTTAATTSPPSPTTTSNTQVSTTTVSKTTQFQSTTPISTLVPITIKSTNPASSTTATTTQPSSTTSKTTQVPTTTQPTQTSSMTSKSSQVPTTAQPTQTSSTTSKSSQVPTTTQPTQPSSTTSKSSQVPTTTLPTQTSSTTSKSSQVPTTTQPTQPLSTTSKSSQVPTTTQPTQTSSTTSKSSQVPTTTQPTQPLSTTSKSSQVPTTTQPTQTSSTTSKSSQVPTTTQPTQTSSMTSKSSQVPTTTQSTQPSSTTSKSSQVPTTTQPTQPSSMTSKSSQVPTTTQPTQTSSTTSRSSQVPSTTQSTQTSSMTSKSSQVPTTTLPTQTSSMTSKSSQVPTTTQPTQASSTTSKSSQVPTTTQPTQTSSMTSKSSQVPTTTQPTQTSSTTSKSSQVPTTTLPTQPSSTLMTSISKTATTSTMTISSPVTSVVTSSTQTLTTATTTLTTRSTSVCSIEKSSTNVSLSIPQSPEHIPLKEIAFHSIVRSEGLVASCITEYETSLKAVLYPRQQDAVNLEPNINRRCVNNSIFISFESSIRSVTLSGNQVIINFIIMLVPSSDFDINKKYSECVGIFLPCALQNGSIFGITEVNTSNATCRPLDLTSTTHVFDSYSDICIKGTYNNVTRLCEEAVTTTTQQPFSCYSCNSVSNDTYCTTHTPCSGVQNTCQTEVRYNKSQKTVSITKTCQENQTCNTNRENKNCVPTNGAPVCFYCCYSSLCNNQTVINETIFKDSIKPKDAMKARKKRDLQVASPAWNSSVPVCRDITPPKFMDCPKSILIEVGKSGILPVDVKLPNVTDNSGGTVFMNVIYPINFTSPYLFKQNTTMKIEAYDVNRNMATCNISIIVIDRVPPELICPTEVVYIKMDTTDGMVNMDYNWSSLGINGSDAVRLEYSPQPSKRISLLESILVTIKAYDQSSNEAVCNFYLFGLPNGCPDWSLSTPQHGTKSCNHNMDSSSVICVMTCDKGYRFVDSATNYTCTENGTWIPHNHVPDCVGGHYPYQDVFTAWNFSLPYINSYNNCSIPQTFEKKLLELFKENCTEAVNVTASNIDIQIRDTAYIESRVQFSSAQRLSSFPCGTRGFLTPTLPHVVLLTPCGNLTLLSISNISSQEVCPEGFVKLSAIENSTIYCYPCTAGMYADTDQCKPCPPGFYQDLVHQTDCKPCPNGTSTISSYTKNITGCLKYCGSGFFSKTGLVPCSLCPHGTFQEIPGSQTCVPCPGNTTTRAPGAAFKKNCSEPCRQGSYSSTGLEPCTPCPKHFYSETPGAITCKECPPGLATALEGTDSVGDCKKIFFCGSNSCTNNASCIEFDHYYTCKCQPGFTGIYCEININECASNPCVNGGTCQDHVNSFRCICPLGYTGSYCERDVDECASSPCKYGICQDGSNMFTCVCYDGFEGYLCDINKDDCVNSQCQNSGQCVDLVGGYTCNCTGTGFSAPHCVNMSSLCDGKLCANGGTCMETNNSFLCLCQEGFYGQFCHMVDDLCASSPCQNGGLCLQSGMTISCECKAGYTGAMCEHDIDDCTKKPCLNGATCRNLPNSFSCSCTDGFTGVLCEEDIYNNCANYSCNQTNTLHCQDTGPGFSCTCRPGWKGALCDVEINECQSNPCVHGTCQDYLNGYTCTCTGGYAGQNCTEDIDECMSSPCLNRGHCNDSQNRFSCVCQAGFTGNMCEIDINECENSPCLNTGSCIDLVNGYYCSCTTLWTGSRCEIRRDSCTSLPCAQGATCNNTETGFLCHCPKGYTGTICDREIKECFPNPCQHNGTCVDQLNNYTCYCATGYYGNNCQHMVDHCSTSNPCKNGGSCTSSIDGFICQCSVNFTGYICEKVKSGSFDLQFFNDSKATSKPPARELIKISQLSICLWVRFDEPGGNGIYLTVSSVSSNDTRQSVQLLIFHSNGIMLSLFPNVPSYNITLNQLNNGMWHHLCLTWSNSDTGTVQVFLDASNGSVTGYYGGQILHGWHQVEVGQVQLKNEVPLFKGKVSQVNIYSSLLQSETIAAMATSCHGDSYYGNLWSWKEFDIYLPDDQFIIRPSLCGDNGCPSGFRGAMCNISIDKSPPVVEHCPEDIKVVSLDRLNQVIWNQPVFSDNVGVAKVEQTAHSPGIYSYGQYEIVYTAFDRDGNSATCSFRVYVTPRYCEIPSPPLNGARDCGYWGQGQYCRIKCLGNKDFTEPTALLYNCGKEGFWDPPRGRVFRFPPCSEVSDPSISLYGSLTLLGPDSCTEDKKTNVTRSVYQVLAQLSLGSECACNLSGIYVDCSSNLQSGRRKRATRSSEYRVSFNFTFSSGEVDGAINQIQSYVKEGKFDMQDFSLDSSQTVFKTQLSCNPDQVLNFKNKCVNCQPGTYQNNTSGSCELCPPGYYTAKEKQLNCSKCPEGQTTESLGATSEIDCYSVCSIGHFWDRVTRLCEWCEAGQYQDEIGQTSCKPCPNGKTTRAEGSTSIQQCIYYCSQGNEMNPLGGCQRCPKGTYKDRMDLEQCQSCPSGFTTKSDGAIFLESCSLVLCPKGQYRNNNNTCLPCPQGSYQPLADQTRCLLCGKGQTTPSSGAISKETCINGSSDECLLGIDDCDTEAECTNSEDSYKCECKLGFTGNGTYCKDNCAGYCGQNGQCYKNSSGFPLCTCSKGYDGLNCDKYIGTFEDLTTGQIAGIATGLAVGLLIILVVWLSLFYMKKRKCKAVLADKLGVPRLHRSELTSGFPAYAIVHNPTFEASPGGSEDNLGSLTSYHHTDWRRSVYAGVEESDGTWSSKPAFSSEGSLGRISFF